MSERLPISAVIITLNAASQLESCLQSVQAAADCIDNGGPAELVVAHLKDGLSRFDDVIGIGAGTDLLADVFGRFCIGK